MKKDSLLKWGGLLAGAYVLYSIFKTPARPAGLMGEDERGELGLMRRPWQRRGGIDDNGPAPQPVSPTPYGYRVGQRVRDLIGQGRQIYIVTGAAISGGEPWITLRDPSSAYTTMRRLREIAQV